MTKHRVGAYATTYVWFFFALLVSALTARPATAAETVLRTTLDNGLKVVIVRNPLAPVVATSINYLVGSNESPKGFPGTAHAVEHMMFRGSPGLTAAQMSNIGSVMGGHYNANTRETLTQYYYTVPAEDLSVALHIEAARMAGIDCTEADWQKERGAIEQEVARDLSSPNYKVYQQMRAKLFAGTPYEHTALGTKESFDKTPAAMLKTFHHDWYVPNNAILVVVGDVVPQDALREVKKIFGAIPARPLPRRPEMALQPVVPDVFTQDSDQPYTLTYLALRMPGYESPDFPALEVLTDILQSRRFALFDPVAQGRALATFYQYMPLPHAGMGLIGAAVPAQTDPAAIENEIRAIVAGLLKDGVSPDLVAAAKQQERRLAEQGRNSISNLASDWADAIALYGLTSPDEDLARIEKVTAADVDRVARKYLRLDGAMKVTLVPKAGGTPVASGGKVGGGESIPLGKSGPVALPDWAKTAMARIAVPHTTKTPHVMRLANGLTLIVQPTDVSDSIELYGFIRNEPDMQEPAGKEGVAMMVDALMSYGTTHLNRLQLQAAQDKIGVGISAGTSFSARALKKDFAAAVALLADNERNPAFPESALAALKPQYAQYLESQRKSPDYLTEQAANAALYPKNDPVLREATAKTMTGLTRDDLVAYHKAVFRPDMTAIAVIGNVTPEEVREIVTRGFGSWTAAGPKPAVDLPPVADSRGGTVSVPNPSRVQDAVSLIHTLSLTRKNADYYAMQLGNAVLGGGIFSARLYNDLRVKSGLVYSVGSYLSASRTRARYVVQYGSDPKNVGKADALIIKDIREMQTTAVPAETLDIAKAFLLRQIPLSESSFRALAKGYLHRFELGLPMDEQMRAARRYVALTPAEVRDACKKWLRPDHLLRVTQGPAPQ